MDRFGMFEATKRKMKTRKRIMVGFFLIVAIAAIVIGTHSASFQRTMKSMWSNYGGGIDRTVTVYDYNGNELRQYSGKFDIQESDTTVFFDDENGRRIKIYNAIVISEENVD